MQFLFLLFLAFAWIHSPAQKRFNQKTAPTATQNIKYGVASYYAVRFAGRKTANGEKYHPGKMTAACNVFPLNSKIKVTNLRNGKSLILKINDRLSRKSRYLVDVSESAAKRLGFLSHGITRAKVQQLKNHLGEK